MKEEGKEDEGKEMAEGKYQLECMAMKAVAILKKLGVSEKTVESVAKELDTMATEKKKAEEEAKKSEPEQSLYEKIMSAKASN